MCKLDIMSAIRILRSIIKKMDAVTILPPESVRGMKNLEKERFNVTVSVPAIRLRPQMVSEYLKKFKNMLLRQPEVKRVQDYSQVCKAYMETKYVSSMIHVLLCINVCGDRSIRVYSNDCIYTQPIALIGR